MTLKEFKDKIRNISPEFDDHLVIAADSENKWYEVIDISITDSLFYYPNHCIIIE